MAPLLQHGCPFETPSTLYYILQGSLRPFSSCHQHGLALADSQPADRLKIDPDSSSNLYGRLAVSVSASCTRLSRPWDSCRTCDSRSSPPPVPLRVTETGRSSHASRKRCRSLSALNGIGSSRSLSHRPVGVGEASES